MRVLGSRRAKMLEASITTFAMVVLTAITAFAAEGDRNESNQTDYTAESELARIEDDGAITSTVSDEPQSGDQPQSGDAPQSGEQPQSGNEGEGSAPKEADGITQDPGPILQQKLVVGEQKPCRDGDVRPGWFKLDDKWCYANQQGQVQTGWLLLGNTWYYLQPGTGIMATGWLLAPDSKWYFLSASGAMVTGWMQQGNTWYYLTPVGGAMKVGWLKDSRSWYYLTSTGAMATGWLKLGKTSYYLTPATGAMKTGWLLLGNSWYFMDNTGAVKTGWLNQGGTWYYLTAPTGAMKTGWLKLNNVWYYLNPPSGAMAVGNVTIGGRVNAFDKSGAWLGYGYRHGMSWAGQQTNYWCGPASGYMALAAMGNWRSASGVALSQKALASNSYMKTDQNGRTKWADNMWATGMNNWLGKKLYSQQFAPSTSFFRQKVQDSFTTTGRPVALDAQEWANGPHYNNHPRVSFSHIMPVEGYDPTTDTMLVMDPASLYYYSNGARDMFSHNLGSFTQFLQSYGIYY